MMTIMISWIKQKFRFSFVHKEKKQNIKKLKTSKFFMSFVILLFIHFIENLNKTKRPKGKIMLVVFFKKIHSQKSDVHLSSVIVQFDDSFTLFRLLRWIWRKIFYSSVQKEKEKKKFFGYLEHNKLTIEDVDEFDEHKQRC